MNKFVRSKSGMVLTYYFQKSPDFRVCGNTGFFNELSPTPLGDINKYRGMR